LALAAPATTSVTNNQCGGILASQANLLSGVIRNSVFAIGQTAQFSTPVVPGVGCFNVSRILGANAARLFPPPLNAGSINILLCGTPGQGMEWTEMRTLLQDDAFKCCPTGSNAQSCRIDTAFVGESGAILQVTEGR
jgi:hypothetical protein